MDDVLKSLVALDLGHGQVMSLDFETPEDRDELLAKGSIHLSDHAALLDLLRDLRGRSVRCVVQQEEQQETIDGMVVGVDCGGDEPLPGARLSLYQPGECIIRTLHVATIHTLTLLDDTAASDLNYFLRAAQSEEDRRSATLHLSPGDHDLLVGYIAPAPAWRVSYRLLFDTGSEGQQAGSEGSVLLQGWGLFDNQLEEDLEHVRLTLVAGMPVSFRYRLYEPKTPERPLVEDEERTVGAPVFFEGAPPPAPAQARAMAPGAPPMMETAKFGMGLLSLSAAADDTAFAREESVVGFSIDEMASSVQITASGSERGALFAYEVGHPVSVARGQSAMVPILGQRLSCTRKLLYNRHKLPDHPVSSLRMVNETGLTLERGPVTVLEDGDYAGEAVVPFTRTGSEVIVPYAVELGIKIAENERTERRIVGISVRNEYLLFQEYDLRHTTYHITSSLLKPAVVVIEHLPKKEYELTETVAPDEQGAGFVRWNVTCAPSTLTRFDVHERMMQHRHEYIRGVSGRQLQDYLKHQFLDKATVAALDGVLDLYRQVEQAEARIQQLGREREAVYAHQRQIQGNLGPLGQQGEEGALRKRYVAELNKLEDTLKAVAAEEERLKKQIGVLQQQIQKKLKELTPGS